MSQVTSIEVLEQAYLRWHRNEAYSQKDLARELKISHSVVNLLLRGKHVFSAQLAERYPGLKRSDTPRKPGPKAGRPSVKPAGAVAVDVVEAAEEPEVDLAYEALEALPNLEPKTAVALSKFAFGELSELLQMINRPTCSRLARYLGYPTRAGRPPKSKSDDAARLAVEEEIQAGEKLTDDFLKGDE